MTRRQFLGLQGIVWTLYAVIHVVATLPAIQPGGEWHLVGIKVLRAASGYALSLPLPWLLRRLLGAKWGLAPLAAMAGVVAFVLGNVWLVVDRTVLAIARSVTPLQVDWRLFPHGFDLDYALALLAWMGGYVVVWHWREGSRREQELLVQRLRVRDAQLHALRQQLSPHFLFNTLNSLRGLIAEDPERARAMVTKLAAFLRLSLTTEVTTSLEHEAGLAAAYLDIERIRVEQPIDVTLDVSTEAGQCRVPSLLLQPLLENALKYGTADASGVRRVRLVAHLRADGLSIDVANTGRLAPDPVDGVGLANARARVAQCYGPAATVALCQRGDWVVAGIHVPNPHDAPADRPDRR